MNPDLGDLGFWYRRAALASQAGDTQVAVGCYGRLLAMSPGEAEAHFYTGYHLYLDGLLDAAEASYRRALSLDGGHADAAWCLAMLRWLRAISAARGAPMSVASRDGAVIPPAIAAKPAWRGEPVPGKTLLLWAEQGHGDTIQFVRYAALAKRRAGRVVVACQGALKRLLSAQPHLADHVVSEGDAVPEFDLQASIMSLPVVFDTRAETIPATCPYLFPPGAAAAPAGSSLLEVGLVWSGNPDNQPMNRYRAMRFTELLPLLEIEGVKFHALQVGRAAQAEAAPYVTRGRLADVAPLLHDFAETARVLAGLDLVVTVDTSVAHLAGALDRPTYLMLARTPDYRWFLSGERSPWYPSLRLFRQKVAGDWHDVVDAVGAAIRRKIGDGEE